ncbi:hypothetical protein K0817_013860 [Microbacterium sp. HD4P20]|uniref:hypothetical protein n=1 Tax=Microbacterium sp. HD4P20 TaxID=2864874 RepID=UPI0020A5419B|nr:hypothetical protein [Microbacterium sp. HD4P20]MCP2637640.1 hypothetical protein [Microbacterium sp. HD4P20]
MTDNAPPNPTPAVRRHPLGLPVLALVGLAALGVPRVILHDLHIIEEGQPAAWILALAPVAVWITVAVAKKVPRPFVTVLMIGVFFGVMLVITHQLLWNFAFDGSPPSLGDSGAGLLIPRIAAVFSGLVTGTLIGAVGGLIAWGIHAVIRPKTPRV